MTDEEARAKIGQHQAELALPWIGWRGVRMLAELPEPTEEDLAPWRAFAAACSDGPPLCVRSETE